MNKHSSAHTPHRGEEIASLLGICLVIITVTWTYSGVRSPIQYWNAWSSITCLVIFLLAPLLAGGTTRRQFRRVVQRISNLVNDPLFWIVALFLGFLFLQKINTGRIKVFDPINAEWLYTPPPFPGLPWSIDPADANDVWHWFFPAGILVITIRHGLKSLWSMHRLLIFIVVHAVVIGGYGIMVQNQNPGLTSSRFPADFFAVFGYPNHAGAFFTLLCNLAVGLGFGFCLGRRHESRNSAALMMGLAACLFASCAVLSISRAAMIFIFFTICMGLLYGGIRFCRELTLAKSVNIAMGAIGVAALGYFWIMGTNAKWVAHEVDALSPSIIQSHLFSQHRMYPLRVASEIWKDYPIYGTGGWGYRHLGLDYMSDAEKELILEGSANVHMDALQFLSEFGLVGFGLLLVVLVYLSVPFFRMRWNQPVPLFAALGLLITLVVSMIDLPFRNPTILCHWTVILVVVSGMLSRPARTQDEPRPGSPLWAVAKTR